MFEVFQFIFEVITFSAYGVLFYICWPARLMRWQPARHKRRLHRQ